MAKNGQPKDPLPRKLRNVIRRRMRLALKGVMRQMYQVVNRHELHGDGVADAMRMVRQEFRRFAREEMSE